MNTNRCHFLRGTGALIGLPTFESIGFRRYASAAATTPPKRMIFMGMGYGVSEFIPILVQSKPFQSK